MIPHTDLERARGVETNGEGKQTTAHLNLTLPISLAEDSYRNRFSSAKAVQRQAKRQRRNANKLPYAGASK